MNYFKKQLCLLIALFFVLSVGAQTFQQTKQGVDCKVPGFDIQVKFFNHGTVRVLKSPTGMQVLCNGVNYASGSSSSSYIEMDRTWNNGDEVIIHTPMRNTIEEMPNVPTYISVLHGPIVLGIKTSTESLTGLVAGDDCWAHIASGRLLPVTEAPFSIGTRAEIQAKLNNLQPVAGKPLCFSADGLFKAEKDQNLTFEPFYRIHDSRYLIYWLSMTETEYADYIEGMADAEREKMLLEERTVDRVTPAEQQPEVDHQMKTQNSYSGYHNEEGWRDARGNGYFSYNLLTKGNENLALMVRYWGNEGGNRTFNIMIDDDLLVTENIVGKWNKDEFVNIEYPIPLDRVKGKASITVKFQCRPDNIAGGVFGVRLLKPTNSTSSNTPLKNAAYAQNPIIWADVPDNAMIRVDDTYYMSSTTMHLSPGLPIMKSKDLVHWEMLNYAYETLVDNDAMNLNKGKDCYGAGSWASSLRYHKGTFYVSTFSATSGKTHVYSTQDIEKGDWKEASFEPALHDHSLFFDDDGRVYMVYGGGDIRIIELTADASAVKTEGINRIIIPNATAAAGGKPGLPAEGSQLIKHQGKYYLFNITWPQNDVRTELVHRADNITGPYEGRVFLKDRGIAQGSIIDTPDEDWYAYQFRDFGAVGRIPYLMPVVWNEEGWPVVANNGKAPDYLEIAAQKKPFSNIIVSDEFKRKKGEPKLPLAWQWNHNPDNSLWSVDTRKGYLRLTTGRIDANITQAKNTLTQRTFGPESSATTAIDITHMKNGDYAGLVALQKLYGFVGVKMEKDSKFIVMEAHKEENEMEQASIPVNQNKVYFRIDCDYNVNGENQRNDKAYFYYSLNGNTWTKIGKPLSMRYTLPHFMGYRFGLFNFATQTIGGYVDFDYFRVTDKIF
jgi:beta-xylosidase